MDVLRFIVLSDMPIWHASVFYWNFTTQNRPLSGSAEAFISAIIK